LTRQMYRALSLIAGCAVVLASCGGGSDVEELTLDDWAQRACHAWELLESSDSAMRVRPDEIDEAPDSEQRRLIAAEFRDIAEAFGSARAPLASTAPPESATAFNAMLITTLAEHEAVFLSAERRLTAGGNGSLTDILIDWDSSFDEARDRGGRRWGNGKRGLIRTTEKPPTRRSSGLAASRTSNDS